MFRLLIILGLFLSACTGRSYQKSEYVSSTFQDKQMAVVVFQMRGKSSFTGAAPKVTFDLVKMNPQIGVASNTIYHLSPGFFGKFNVWEKGYLCVMVEPGFYIIDNISWSQGNVNYFTAKGALPSSNPVQYGAFEVKAGTVNYLGDLEVFCHQAALGINKVNRFDAAKDALEKEHPELAPYLTHADFFPAGYCTFGRSQNR
jgi:hypothetical protein